MSQTLVIRTPDEVTTTSRTFPKQGMFNLKITKNGTYDTVELWFQSQSNNITLELDGALFQSTAQITDPNLLKTVPENPTAISGSTLALTSGTAQYMKIKLNEGISVAHLRCSYAAKSLDTLVMGGNVSGQAFVDYSTKPYISTSLRRMFVSYPVRSNITKWDTTSVISLWDTFLDNVTFNQDLSSWDVSNVWAMNGTFLGATSFNQPIGNWDVRSATSMIKTFLGATSFNHPISNWDVSRVGTMREMFNRATSFNQDLSSWAAKFNVNVELSGFFLNNTWGTSNYDKFLNALWTDINSTRPQEWALRTRSKLLGMGTSKYSAASAAARSFLIANGWTFTDGGLAE